MQLPAPHGAGTFPVRRCLADMAPQQDPKITNPKDWDTRQRVMEPAQARSGAKTGHMRYVLGFGLAGIVVAFFLVWYFLIRA